MLQMPSSPARGVKRRNHSWYRQRGCYRIPDNFQVDIEIAVCHAITHTLHASPRYLRMAVKESLVRLVYCFNRNVTGTRFNRSVTPWGAKSSLRSAGAVSAANRPGAERA